MPRRVVAALKLHGNSNDDVLWAALFVLAVLVRDNSCVFERAKAALAWAGVLRVSKQQQCQGSAQLVCEAIECCCRGAACQQLIKGLEAHHCPCLGRQES